MFDLLIIVGYVGLVIMSVLDTKTIKKLRTENQELKKALEELYREGSRKAEAVARKTYFKAMKKVGFVI